MLSHGALQIPCKIYEPGCGAIRRCILGVHGFGGDKESSCLEAVADEMGLYETATVCFDFPAHGESPVTDRMLTLGSCTESLLAVAAMAKEAYPDCDDFCLFATSFGCYVSLLCLDRLTALLGRVKLVLRAPAVQMADTFLHITGLTEEEILEQGRFTYGFERIIEVPYSFYQELAANNAMTNYNTPMMILQGGLDEIVRLHDVEFFRLLNDQAKLVVFPGTDHRFKKDGELDMVVDLTRDWFLCEEVLLSDWR